MVFSRNDDADDIGADNHYGEEGGQIVVDDE